MALFEVSSLKCALLTNALCKKYWLILRCRKQILFDIAKDIARAYPRDRRPVFESAAKSFAIPYWDWIIRPELPFVVTSSQILVESPDGQRYIDNPLYNYTFHPGPEGNGFPDSFTVRLVQSRLQTLQVANGHGIRWQTFHGQYGGLTEIHKLLTTLPQIKLL